MSTAVAIPTISFPHVLASGNHAEAEPAIAQERSRKLVEMIEHLANGDERAMAELYDQTNRLVFSLAFRILNDKAAAEEVTLDVFLQVWRQAGSFSVSRGTPLAWLMTITRTRAIDRLRSSARGWRANESLDEVGDIPARVESPEEASLIRERRSVVRAALSELSAEHRVLIETAYFEGMSHTEIAAKFNLPLGTVKTRIRAGMSTLRGMLSMEFKL